MEAVKDLWSVWVKPLQLFDSAQLNSQLALGYPE